MPGPFKDRFSEVASNYAEFRPRYPRELFQWLASTVDSNRAVWDCATGNGQAAFGLAEFFDQVLATDASAEQIRNATPHPRIRYSVARAESNGLPDKCVDLVTVAQATHWLDLAKFYAEVKRVLRPGGVIALWCYGVMRFDNPAVQELLDDFYNNIVGPFWSPERRYVETGYKSLAFPFEEFTAPPFSMHAEFTLPRLLGYLRTWSATQGFIKAKGCDPVEAFGEKVGKLWQKPPRIDWPVSMRVGRFI